MASLDLGFVDRRAASIEVPVRGHDYTIHQSPSVLASSRAGGTTGAGACLEALTTLSFFLSLETCLVPAAPN